MTALGDPHRVGDGFRKVPKALFHLGRRLQIELVVVKAHAVGVGDDRTRLQAEEDVMRFGVVLAGVVRIVGGDQRNPRTLRQSGEALGHPGLLLHPMVLDLEEKVLPEDPLVLERRVLGAGLVTLEQPAGHLPTKAARERDQALRMLG